MRQPRTILIGLGTVAAALMAIGGWTLLAAQSPATDEAPATEATASQASQTDDPPAGEAPPRTESPVSPIDGNRAFGYLRQICAIGPRQAGSAANARQRKLVADHFTAQGATIHEQAFQAIDPASGRTVELVNLIGSWFPERKDRVLICAHYDTRPFADQEVDPARRRQPFIGANDGGSGVALLMELAHHLKDSPTEWGVDLILLDGEELVYGRQGEYFLGSRAFGQAYARGVRDRKIQYRYRAGILLDMVGGRGLTIEREPYSLQAAGGLVEQVWGVAARLGETCFVRDIGREVLDDHIALNRAGIPTIDLIDFDYPHWHLITDTPEQCAPESLASVGRVVETWLRLPPTRR